VALIRQSIAEHGIELPVIVMTDGDKAVRYLDEVDAGTTVCPEIVILDLNLPKTTGRDVLARIRASPTCGQVPVAVFSSSDAAKDVQDASRLGANRYVKKATNLDDFLKIGGVIKELLEMPRN
jgi:chemotaxis family two-component system response regulator Rcp1